MDKHGNRIEIFNSTLVLMQKGWYISKNGNKIMGDISILGIVGSNILTDKTFISGVRINSVINIAYFIANAINFALNFTVYLKSCDTKNEIKSKLKVI